MATSTIKNTRPTGIGDPINLIPYNSASNAYTAPEDGLVTVDVAGTSGNNVTINIDGINFISVAGISGSTQTLTIPVYKGMIMYTRFNVGNNNYARYRPFTY